MEQIDSDINIINLKNGLYYINENLLLPHTPDYLSINQKSIMYDKKRKAEAICKFLKEILYPRDIRTGIEAIAYTFHRDYTIETIFMLHGFGANGKTVFTNLLTSLHGADNVSNVPLSEMLGDRFALSDMENKDLNIDNQLVGQTIKEAAVLKKLTGGSRQRIRIQRKNQKAYDTTIYAKLFFNANRIPDSQDISDAYNRRLTIISFPNQFTGPSEDKQLIAKLTTEEEISGIFNILMHALRRIIKTNELYVNEKTIDQKWLKYERMVNPIKSFQDEVIAEDSTEDSHASKEVFYDAYVKYCNKYALPKEKYETFCGILKRKFNLGEIRPTINEERVIHWKGITLIPEHTPITEKKTLV